MTYRYYYLPPRRMVTIPKRLPSFGGTLYHRNENSRIFVFVTIFSRDYLNKLPSYTQIFVLSTTLKSPPNKKRRGNRLGWGDGEYHITKSLNGISESVLISPPLAQMIRAKSSLL